MVISDEKLNLYVINPSLLSREDNKRIEKAIVEDERVKDYIDELKELYDSRLVGQTFLPVTNVYFLKPLGHPLYSKNKIKLVAESAALVKDEPRLVNTYISADEYVMINVHYNPAREEYTLYLICDEMEKVKNARVKILGIEEDFTADSDGILKIRGHHITPDQGITVKLK